MLNGIVDSQKVRALKAASSSQSTWGSSFFSHRSEERQEIEMLKETLRQRDKEMRQWDKEQQQRDEDQRLQDECYAQSFAQQQIIL
jgi:hypothetical protein